MIEVVLTLAGIIVPSALLTAAVRRWFGGISWRESALLLALVLAWLHLGAFTTAMPLALDEVVRGHPYRGVVGPIDESRNPDTNDTVKQMLPWMEVAREELFAFRAPLWNRYSFSGYPLLGNGQSAPLSPFFLATLPVPLPKQIVAMAGLKLFVGLLFGALFLREERLGRAASLFGSIVFAFSVFQNVYLYYPLSAVSFLLPALAWAIVRVVRGGAVRDGIALALVVAAAFAGGHPETVLLIAVGGAMILAIELAAPAGPLRRGPAAGRAVGFAAAGALLAAPVWLPAVELILESQRIAAIGAGEVGSPRYPATALWVAFNPDGFGNPARGNWSWILHYIMVAPTYVGLLPLALLPGALLARSSDRRARLMVAGGIVAFLIAFRWTWIGEGFNRLPLAEWSANDRMRLVMIFLFAAAAARSLERIARGAWSGWDLAGSALAAAGSLWVLRARLGITLEPVHAVGLVALASFWLAWIVSSRLASLRPRRQSVVTAVAAAAIALELWLFNLPFNALTPREYFAPPLPIVDTIHELAPEEPFRIVGHDWVLLPNASAQYGLEDIRGSDPLAWGPYTRFFRLVQAEGQSLDVGRVQDVGHPAIDFLNVRFLLGGPGSEFGPSWKSVYDGLDGELFENLEWLPRFYAPRELVPPASGAVEAVRDFRQHVVVEGIGAPRANRALDGMWLRRMAPGSFRMTMDARGETFIASSEPALPGWTVEVDGARVPIHRVNGAFIGFFVPAGGVRVRVAYEPRSWRVGLLMGLIGALALARFCGRGFHPRRAVVRRPPGSSNTPAAWRAGDRGEGGSKSAKLE
ncbi:MAG TPA: YfhO family protein [Thermoanaerobaculia bacterium]|nr:YfhO family protein [Thermoanaerobaculia bacterium]